MIVLIWEDVNNCITSITNTLDSKFPREARYYLSRRPEAAEIEKLTRPPFVFTGWLIYANAKTPIKILQQLEESRSQNIIVIRVTNQRDFKETVQNLASLNVKAFDNHAVDKGTVLHWIESELCVSEAMAKYIYNRVGGYIKDVVFAVQKLQRSNQVITHKLVRSLVDKNQNSSMMEIAEYLIGIQSQYTNVSDIYATLYKFRYAESWILETLISDLTLYIKVFQLVSDCVLDISNYATQVDLLHDKFVRKQSKWKLKRIILNYGKTSLERIILTKAMLDDCGKSYFDLIKIIQLVSIGGS